MTGITESQKKPGYLLIDYSVPVFSDEYDKIEEELLSLLSFPGAKTGEKLLAGAIWLDILRDFLKTVTGQAEDSQETRNKALETFFSSMKNNDYERPFRIAGKQQESPLLHRILIGTLIAFRNNPEKKRSLFRMFIFMPYIYLRNILRIGKIRINPVQKSFPYAAFKKYPMIPFTENSGAIIEKWIMDFIRSRKLLLSENIRSGYMQLIMNYALIRWYSTSLAWQKKHVIGPDEINEAIKLVNENYMFHPEMEKLYNTNPVLKDIIDKAFSSKSTPGILVNSPVKFKNR
jgi:hypothetical protein